MTPHRTKLRTLLALSTSLALAACGGGSDDGTGPGPSGASVTSKGVVTSTAGGITVNGVTFSTAGASVTVEDAPASAAALAPGMVAKVKGTVDDRTGSAVEIEVEDDLSGRASGRDGDVLLVGGHRVEVDDSTEISGGSGLDDLVGERVRVHGHGRANGATRASRLEREDRAGEDFEVKGFVSGFAAGPPATFTLKVTRDASVGYAVTVASGVSVAGIGDGAFVEVRSASAPAGGAFTAVAIQLEDSGLGRNGDEVEVEGLVESGTSAAFTVEGQAVVTGPSTRWENGLPEELVPGVKVEAEGRLQDGVLQAHKVSFRENVRLQGEVTDLVLSDATHATFRVLGITVRVDPFAELDIDSGLAALSGIVRVRARPHRNGTDVVATRLESRNDDRPIVQGPVSAADATAGTLSILGVTVTVGSGTEFRDSRGATDVPISRADFFAAVGAGPAVVKARGSGPEAFTGGVLAAEEAELESTR